MRGKWQFIAGLLVLPLLLAACGEQDQPVKSNSRGVMTQKQVISLAETTKMETLDLSKASGYRRLLALNEGLYRLGDHNQLVPGLATKATISNGGKTYTFHLRQAKWSNGDALTANDFVYSWQRSVDPATKSTYAYLFEGIKNADAITEGRAKPSSLGVSAPDKQTLVVQLTHPIAYFQNLMAYSLFAPQNKSVVQRYGNSFGKTSTHQVYSGPFKIVNWRPSDNHWHLVKNPQYWDKKSVYLTRINERVVTNPATGLADFKADKLDEIQIIGHQTRAIQSDPGYRLRPYALTKFIEYNQRDHNGKVQSLLQQPQARLAISRAIDRQALVTSSLGIASPKAKGLIPAGLLHNTAGEDFANEQQRQDTLAFRPQQARSDWGQALRRERLPEVTLRLVTPSDPVSKSVAQSIKEQLTRNLTNLKIKIISPDNATTLYHRGDFDLYLNGWGADFPDPLSFLQILQSDNPFNHSHWSNHQYDKLIQKITVESDQNSDSRWDKMLQAEAILMKEQAITPLYQQTNSYLVNRKLNGVIHNTIGAASDYKSAYLVQ